MRIYIVQKGDTLFKIAKKHQVSVEEIIRVNTHIADPDYILPGMKIKLPKQMSKESVAEKDTSRVKDETSRAARTHERPLGSVAEMEDRGGVDLTNRVPLTREPHEVVQSTEEGPAFEKSIFSPKEPKIPQEDAQATEQAPTWQETYHTKQKMEQYSQGQANQMHKESPPFYMDSRQLPFCPCCMYHWHMQQVMLEYEKSESNRKRYPAY